MKTNIFKSLLLALIAAMLPQLASAHDFEVGGIYYNINGNEATVTYRGSDSYLYENEYEGAVNIPPAVTYNGTTYSVTSIGDGAFSFCEVLTSVTIPNSVTSIGENAFSGCSGLTSITIPNSVTSIEDFTFQNCTGLTSVTIPNSVTTIGYCAFFGCTGLTSVTIGSSVTSIGDSAFRGCSGLTSVTIPNSVTSIGEYAFYNCTGLTSVTIGSSVTTIGWDAFSGCSGLTSMVVESGNTKYDSRNNCNAIIETASNTLISGCKNTVIPNSVTSIGDWAFSDCTGLKSIYSKIQNPGSVSYGYNIFKGVITTHCKLYVPTGKVEDYQFTAPWSDFLNILEEGGGGGSTPVYGDVNGDGHVNSVDVTIIYNILLGNDKGETHNE